MQAIFDKALHTDRSKKHTRECERDFNTQNVYEKLNMFCTKSTKDRVNSSETLSHITLAKIG